MLTALISLFKFPALQFLFTSFPSRFSSLLLLDSMQFGTPSDFVPQYHLLSKKVYFTSNSVISRLCTHSFTLSHEYHATSDYVQGVLTITLKNHLNYTAVLTS